MFWVEEGCRSEGAAGARGLPSPHTNTQQRISDPLHLNHQQNSDYTCILCAALRCGAALQGFTPVLSVLFEFFHLCVCKSAPELKERSRKSESHCNRDDWEQPGNPLLLPRSGFSPFSHQLLCGVLPSTVSRPPSPVPVLHLLLRDTGAAFCDLSV